MFFFVDLSCCVIFKFSRHLHLHFKKKSEDFLKRFFSSTFHSSVLLIRDLTFSSSKSGQHISPSIQIELKRYFCSINRNDRRIFQSTGEKITTHRRYLLDLFQVLIAVIDIVYRMKCRNLHISYHMI